MRFCATLKVKSYSFVTVCIPSWDPPVSHLTFKKRWYTLKFTVCDVKFYGLYKGIGSCIPLPHYQKKTKINPQNSSANPYNSSSPCLLPNSWQTLICCPAFCKTNYTTMSKTLLMELLCHLNELVHRKHSGQGLAHIKCPHKAVVTIRHLVQCGGRGWGAGIQQHGPGGKGDKGSIQCTWQGNPEKWE